MGVPARMTRRCSNSVEGDTNHRPVAMAITIQLATVGETQRRRARAGTVWLCRSCMKLVDDVPGRRVRELIAKEIKRQAFSVGLQRGG